MMMEMVSRQLISLLIIMVLLEMTLSKQAWIQQPGYAEVNPGETVLLTCIIANQEGECRWRREGQPVGMFPGKYEWSGDHESGDCSLLIKDAELDYDDGHWQCSVTPSRFKVC